MTQNYDEMCKTLDWKTKLENDKKELNEVDHYKQTIVQADLNVETDAIIVFMEEIIKRFRGDQTAEDFLAFQDLVDLD